MGFLDLFRRPVSLAPVATAPPTVSEAIPGGANFRGRLIYEPNVELRDQSGYGRAGTYDPGQWQQMVLSNPFVKMGLDHVLRPVKDARVEVEQVPDSVIGTGVGRITEENAKLHADFVKWALTEHFQLSRLSKAAAKGALLSGFSLFSPYAEETPCPLVPSGVAFALKDAPQCLPNSLDPASPWRVDDTGRLVGIGQLGPVGMSGRYIRSMLKAEDALLFSWDRAAGNFAGESQLRACWYFAAKVMPVLGKMVGVTLLREGPGLPQAIAVDKDAKLSPVQREELIAAYADMGAHESSGLVMPAGWRTEWTFSPVSNKGHVLDIYERMGMYILQTFGAQQLMLGMGATGSRSVGETHDARSMAMVAEVLSFLAEVYNGVRGEADGLVKRIVDWNFGPQVAYPRVKLTPQRPELGPKEMAEAAKIAKEAGLLTPTLKDQNAIRERLSLGPLSVDEFAEMSGAGVTTALNGAQVTAATALMQAVADGQLPYEAALESLVTFYNVDPKRAEKLMAALKTFKPETKSAPAPAFGGPAADAPAPPALSASAPRSTWVPWRPLRASESKLKLPALDEFFATSRDRFSTLAQPQVLAMLGAAGPAIERAMADGVLSPAEVAAIPLDATRLREMLGKYTTGVRETGAGFVREELSSGPLTAAGPEDEADVIAAADEVVVAVTDALETRMVNRLRSEIQREAIDTMRTGGNASEVVRRVIARQLDTGAFKADAGSVTAKVFAVGRDEAARMIGGVASVELSAILDAGTCDVCRALDGKTAAFNSPEHDEMLPPVRDCSGGDNCRCLLVFIPEENA